MRRYASTVVVPLGAAGKEHATCFPCHQVNVKDHDFVFTRYAR